MNQFSKNLQNVTDPSEWKFTKIPELSQLDSLQRCFICKEFLRAPVSTACNHTFCSQCIREYLVINSHCPLCQTEQFESNLRRQILLEEIVACYSSFRPLLLSHLKEEDSGLNESERKSPGVANTEVIEVISDSDSANDSSTVLGMEPANKKMKTECIPHEMNGNSEIRSVEVKESIPSPQEMVSCPICSEQMTAELLQSEHIDDCLTGKKNFRKSKSPGITTNYQSQKKRPNSKTAISSFFQPIKPKSSQPANKPRIDHENFYFNEVKNHNREDIRRLPKLNFSSLTTPKLKEKLAAIKLPTQGTRYQLELRYNQYYILFNSNLDSNHPIPEKLLKQKLNQWELSHLAFSASSSTSLFSSRNSLSNKSITDKDFLVKLWVDTYKDEFKDLVTAAKKTMHKQNDSKSKVITQTQPQPQVHEPTEGEHETTNIDNQEESAQDKELTTNGANLDFSRSLLFLDDK